jgi:hypothetical protein
LALEEGDAAAVEQTDKLLAEMGGREEYQRASQLSTSFHSTSKWVLGSLARRGWLYGIRDNKNNMEENQPTTPEETNLEDATNCESSSNQPDSQKAKTHRKRLRRVTRLLEVGAINTELLDAATTSPLEDNDGKASDDEEDDDKSPPAKTGQMEPNRQSSKTNHYKLQVRAIDIHSMDERIEEADFLTIPYIHADVSERYDVIVCSMVLNCVTTPVQRGKMLARLYHHLRPGGILFLTIPKFCLTKSAFLTPGHFQKLLSVDGVGFRVEETKESPRVAFFVCHRPETIQRSEALNPIWTKPKIRNKGKKFPNQFSVVLEENEVFGRASFP